jgi:hypothetical protein
LAIGEMKIGQRQYAPREPLVLRPHAAEQDGTSMTRTDELSASRFDQVGMVGGNFRATKLTTF